ncbi:hypothetical protein [Rhizobium rhizogenes]|uniref:hypothetical protein n=1 Tax=Rhizobium rhizogenes TaxID=359 RepID=UPI0022C79649|nr:hypothetical protein [Rhizobium rhizogenes]MCZ7481182.1 hypothetical protein [Rhizobium rhizogenes]
MNALRVCSQCATGCGLSALELLALKGDARRGVSNDTAGPKALRTTVVPVLLVDLKMDQTKAGNGNFFGERAKVRRLKQRLFCVWSFS